MNGLLDPVQPWPWLLYALAGAGFVAWLVPTMLNHVDQLQRDVFRSSPAAMAFLYIVLWLFWPVVAGSLILSVTWGGILTVTDWVRGR